MSNLTSSNITSSSSKTICDFILSVKSRPGVAIEHFEKNGWKQILWAQYYNYIEQVTGGLHSLGVKPGDKIAIFANTRYEWAVADYGILCSGAVTVPIYQSNTAEDVQYILNDSESVAVFCEDQLTYDRFKSIQSQCPGIKNVFCMNNLVPAVMSWDELLRKGQAFKNKNPDFFEKSVTALTQDTLATICYTSGTTGVPKGVCLNHEQIYSEVTEVFTLLDITPKDKSLTFLPYAHIFGRVEHWAQMYIGWTMAYAQNIDKLRDNLVACRPTFLVAVPRIFEKIYAGVISQAETSPLKNKIFKWALDIGYKVSDSRVNKTSLPIQTALQYQLAKKLVFDKLAQKMGGRLRFAISGGAPLSKEVGTFFHASDLLILEGYGLTETTAGIYINNRFEYKFGTVGKAIGDVECKIAEDGEILVRSKKIMKGYYNNTQATKEVLSDDGWFSTGDIGELQNGYLKITDRKKDLIKTGGGKYVAPQKLENLLKLSKFVSFVLIHGDRKKYIVALLTLNQDEIKRYATEQQITFTDYANLSANPKIKDLIRDVVADTNTQLASYETIKNFAILPAEFTVETGEITPSLKVKRKFCDKKYESTIRGLYGDEISH